MKIQIETRIAIYGDDVDSPPEHILATSIAPVEVERLDNSSATLHQFSAAAADCVEDMIDSFKKVMQKQPPSPVIGANAIALEQHGLRLLVKALDENRVRVLEAWYITLPGEPAWYCVKIKKV